MNGISDSFTCFFTSDLPPVDLLFTYWLPNGALLCHLASSFPPCPQGNHLEKFRSQRSSARHLQLALGEDAKDAFRRALLQGEGCDLFFCFPNGEGEGWILMM